MNFLTKSNNTPLEGVVFQILQKTSCVASGIYTTIAKQHFAIESFPFPLILNIYCKAVSFVLKTSEGYTLGVFSLFRTLLASLYVFWLCPQPSIV